MRPRMKNIRIALLVLLFAGAPMVALPRSADSALVNAAGDTDESTGNVNGKVVDGATGAPVNAALVFVKGTKLRQSSDGDGLFLIEKVPAGTATLSVSRGGYNTRELSVAVVPGEAFTWAIALARLKR